MIINPVQTIITPDIALDYFTNRSHDCRPFNKRYAQKIADDLVSGRIHGTPPTIAFLPNGKLRDGQCICWAIATSGVSLECIIITIDEDDAYLTVNASRQESAATRIRNMVNYSSMMVPIANLQYALETQHAPLTKALTRTNVSRNAAIDICLSDKKSMSSYIDFAFKLATSLNRPNKKGLSAFSAAAFIASRYDDADEFDRFAYELTNASTKNKTVKTLRKKIIYTINQYEMHWCTYAATKTAIVGLILNGFNKFRNGVKNAKFDDATKDFDALMRYEKTIVKMHKVA